MRKIICKVRCERLKKRPNNQRSPHMTWHVHLSCLQSGKLSHCEATCHGNPAFAVRVITKVTPRWIVADAYSTWVIRGVNSAHKHTSHTLHFNKNTRMSTRVWLQSETCVRLVGQPTTYMPLQLSASKVIHAQDTDHQLASWDREMVDWKTSLRLKVCLFRCPTEHNHILGKLPMGVYTTDKVRRRLSFCCDSEFQPS